MSSSASSRLCSFLQNPLVNIVQASSIVHCINEYAFDVTTSGDIVFAEKFSARNGKLDTGDVVIALSPHNAKLKVCKRIVALPGETVYVRSKTWSYPEVVPEGHVWLEGDNAENSTDSRTYGPVPLAMIRARVFFKAWPPTDIGRVRAQVPKGASPVVKK